MAEDKAEGEVRKTSSGSSVAEGGFSRGREQQLNTIEEQLEKAQATLFDLQNLKARLEAERQENRLKEREEQEILAAKKIKAENETLRHELRGYQGEINSLKDIISSLKDDLVRTAERLSDKVEVSLRAIGEPTGKHPHRVTHYPARPEPPKEHNFFNDHLDSAVHKSEAQDEKPKVETNASVDVAPKSEITQQYHPEVEHKLAPAEPPVEAKPMQPDPVKSEPTVAEEKAESVPAAPPTTIAPVTVATAEVAASPIHADPQPAVTTEPSVAAEAVDELNDEDFLEYEDIKRELMALEEEHIFKPTDGAEPETKPVQEAKSDQPIKSKKKLFSFLNKIPMPQKKEEPKDNTSSAPLKNAQDFKHHFWGKKEEASAPAKAENTPEAATPAVAAASTPVEVPPAQIEVAKSEPAPIQPATPAPAEAAPAAPIVNKPEEAVSAPQIAEKSEPAPVVAEVPVQQEIAPPQIVSQVKEAAAEPDKEKQISKLNNVFKKRKKKVTGEMGDNSEERKSKGTGGAGKLLVRAAIFILVIAAGGIAYRVNNAENLRQMYTSKAKESVESAKVKDTPDGFNNIDPEVKYREAYADLPFADTVWTSYKDGDLGIVLEYPKNTSFRLKPVGSSNLWFLRKDGYLLKVEKIETDQSLQQYSESITSTVKYTVEAANVRNHDTLHLILDDNLPVRGNVYLVKMDGNIIYKIWYKTYAPNENVDDEQRVKRMLDTLDFLPAES